MSVLGIVCLRPTLYVSFVWFAAAAELQCEGSSQGLKYQQLRMPLERSHDAEHDLMEPKGLEATLLQERLQLGTRLLAGGESLISGQAVEHLAMASYVAATETGTNPSQPLATGIKASETAVAKEQSAVNDLNTILGIRTTSSTTTVSYPAALQGVVGGAQGAGETMLTAAAEAQTAFQTAAAEAAAIMAEAATKAETLANGATESAIAALMNERAAAAAGDSGETAALYNSTQAAAAEAETAASAASASIQSAQQRAMEIIEQAVNNSAAAAQDGANQYANAAAAAGTAASSADASNLALKIAEGANSDATKLSQDVTKLNNSAQKLGNFSNNLTATAVSFASNLVETSVSEGINATLKAQSVLTNATQLAEQVAGNTLNTTLAALESAIESLYTNAESVNLTGHGLGFRAVVNNATWLIGNLSAALETMQQNISNAQATAANATTVAENLVPSILSTAFSTLETQINSTMTDTFNNLVNMITRVSTDTNSSLTNSETWLTQAQAAAGITTTTTKKAALLALDTERHPSRKPGAAQSALVPQQEQQGVVPVLANVGATSRGAETGVSLKKGTMQEK